MDEAVKHDQCKLRYDLIPPEALEELAAVYTMGAAKYADENWRKGMAWRRIFGAIMRHMWAWMAGEDRDSESGLSHLAHAAWGCFTLMAYAKGGLGQDDRPAINTPMVQPSPPAPQPKHVPVEDLQITLVDAYAAAHVNLHGERRA